ncbi:hypothetical protein N7E70_021485 [Aminobacter sp. NyZ550]|jgi:hypothetical protein|uniref:ABC-type antimicrobial peptide transport system permease subunit n=2 Tax=Aminobacter TaxID=31988 RepID=A0AAC8YRJ6_AMIAI|nr:MULTISPECIES: hypothetical protein [Aminobacter]AMS43240.1 hypothetical protein AA2016_4325 [Aminobacter aminovorans]MBA8905564.1 ABC-type antimicrobial peptide transport system permease subunit [Aminobacter ciceronei]MBA9019137.1 ABC-type antimicrobial peptide transport system permease subunit [Aminobacter ciceronei]MBB3706210.1 ABC-type antimicrobial peptide transport system permease subunit [Aminobacter aminovorans]MRX37225.1 hypothetical protein [Aminobacter sp. MDW-2]
MTDIVNRRTLSMLGLAMAASAALIVLFVLCALVGVLFPSLQVTHAWVGLFTLAPVTSPQAWLEGIFFSLVFGIIAGAIVAAVHNAVAARGL